jgi:hypothetical protein
MIDAEISASIQCKIPMEHLAPKSLHKIGESGHGGQTRPIHCAAMSCLVGFSTINSNGERSRPHGLFHLYIPVLLT